MFFHIFKYELLTFLRNKSLLFWMLAFPMILGTFFYVAFGNLYSSEIFSEIPVAVVKETGYSEDSYFETALEEANQGEASLFDVQYADSEKALDLLEDGEVSGVIYVGDEITLSVKSEGTNQTIIKFFLDQYKSMEQIITEAAEKDPTRLQDVVNAMTADINCSTERKISDGNQDTTVQYFYNLVAMSCLFASLAGLNFVIKNQGNLSQIGARRCVSPVHKLKSVTAGLLANMLVCYVLNAVGLSYLIFVLRINFGASALPLYGITLVGSVMGVALGFFVGSIGRAGEGAKSALLSAVSMFFCFMSGLMVSNMRQVVDKYAPWFNRINPAALISDSFYSLNIYPTYDRLVRNLVTLVIIAAVCTAGGFLMTRRQKYASL
jgi:ABC-2 type transport system permease protein